MLINIDLLGPGCELQFVMWIQPWECVGNLASLLGWSYTRTRTRHDRPRLGSSRQARVPNTTPVGHTRTTNATGGVNLPFVPWQKLSTSSDHDVCLAVPTHATSATVTGYTLGDHTDSATRSLISGTQWITRIAMSIASNALWFNFVRSTQPDWRTKFNRSLENKRRCSNEMGGFFIISSFYFLN